MKSSAILSPSEIGVKASILVGYGVIGSPSDSGSFSLGSSPGTPAIDRHEGGGSMNVLVQVKVRTTE